jgi:hypothetical protein
LHTLAHRYIIAVDTLWKVRNEYMDTLTNNYLNQLDLLIDRVDRFLNQQISNAFNEVELMTSAIAAIDRIAGLNSTYSQQVHEILKFVDYKFNVRTPLYNIISIAYALRNDLANGFLTDVKETIHGELFTDFLDMADYLSSEGFKDAAAVIVGGVLESHLHQLAIKHSIDLEVTAGSNVKPRRADQINGDLAKKNVYNLLEQKNVTAWLDLRNKAAHAKYGEYTKDHVSLMLLGVRGFISHYPA